MRFFGAELVSTYDQSGETGKASSLYDLTVLYCRDSKEQPDEP